MLTYNELIQKITELERKITYLEALVNQNDQKKITELERKINYLDNKNQIIEYSIDDLTSIVGQIVEYLNKIDVKKINN